MFSTPPTPSLPTLISPPRPFISPNPPVPLKKRSDSQRPPKTQDELKVELAKMKEQRALKKSLQDPNPDLGLSSNPSESEKAVDAGSLNAQSYYALLRKSSSTHTPSNQPSSTSSSAHPSVSSVDPVDPAQTSLPPISSPSPFVSTPSSSSHTPPSDRSERWV